MSKLTAELLLGLDQALSTTFADIVALRGFVDTHVKGSTGFSFDDKVPFNSTLEQARNTYIRHLNDNGLIQHFLKPYFQEFAQNFNVQEFKTVFESKWDVLAAAADALRFKKELFHCNFILKKLVFIDREKLKDFIYDLVHEKENACLLITGESGSGLSYTGYYLSHIADVTKTFNFVKIDFDAIFKRTQGQIQLLDVAKEILFRIPEFKLSFALADETHFKYEEFIGALWNFLDKSTDKYLFFIDQFNHPYTQDVSDFIHSFAKNLLDGLVKNYYVALAGFKDLETWDYEVKESADIVKIQSFSEGQLTGFVKALHTALAEEYEIEFSADDLVAELKNSEPFFAPELFVPGAKPNVLIIGRGLQAWLKAFKEKIEADN